MFKIDQEIVLNNEELRDLRNIGTMLPFTIENEHNAPFWTTIEDHFVKKYERNIKENESYHFPLEEQFALMFCLAQMHKGGQVCKFGKKNNFQLFKFVKKSFLRMTDIPEEKENQYFQMVRTIPYLQILGDKSEIIVNKVLTKIIINILCNEKIINTHERFVQIVKALSQMQIFIDQEMLENVQKKVNQSYAQFYYQLSLEQHQEVVNSIYGYEGFYMNLEKELVLKILQNTYQLREINNFQMIFQNSILLLDLIGNMSKKQQDNEQIEIEILKELKKVVQDSFEAISSINKDLDAKQIQKFIVAFNRSDVKVEKQIFTSYLFKQICRNYRFLSTYTKEQIQQSLRLFTLSPKDQEAFYQAQVTNYEDMEQFLIDYKIHIKSLIEIEGQELSGSSVNSIVKKAQEFPLLVPMISQVLLNYELGYDKIKKFWNLCFNLYEQDKQNLMPGQRFEILYYLYLAKVQNPLVQQDLNEFLKSNIQILQADQLITLRNEYLKRTPEQYALIQFMDIRVTNIFFYFSEKQYNVMLANPASRTINKKFLPRNSMVNKIIRVSKSII
eukprot:403368577